MADPLKLQGFDHLEMAVPDIEEAAQPFLRLGFEKAGVRELHERKLKSLLLRQNQISLLLSTSSLPADPVYRFLETHGSGIFQVAFECPDAIQAFQAAFNAGAEPLLLPKTTNRAFGAVDSASIRAGGHLGIVFISRTGSLFQEGFDAPLRPSNRGIVGLSRIEHLALAVKPGELPQFGQFFETVLGWTPVEKSDWYGDPTGVHSKSYDAPSVSMSVTINEGCERLPKVDEFLKIHHGSGWQHAAFEAPHLVETMRNLRKESLSFLKTPASYYETLPERCPRIEENVNELEALQIQIDNDPNGYLLQVYTNPLFGGFSVELLQRKGGKGLGAENYLAWEKALARERERTSLPHPA